MDKTFECKICNFSALLKTNYERHLKTSKHILKAQVSGKIPTVIEPTPVADDHKVQLQAIENALREEYETKLQAMKNEMLLMKSEFLQMSSQANKQQPPTMPQPTIIHMPAPPAQLKRQKILPITYVRKVMKKASVIEKCTNEDGVVKYKNRQDAFNVKPHVTVDDMEKFVNLCYEEGLKAILNRFITAHGGREKMPIVCVDRRRKRFLFHIKTDETVEWVEDESHLLITFFIKCIVDALSYVFIANTEEFGDLLTITGLVDESRSNYCMKKLISICETVFCITNLVEDFNGGFDEMEDL